MRKHVLMIIGLIVLVAVLAVAWLAWPDKAQLDVAQVTGRRPAITDPRRQLIPTMNVADAVGWPAGAKPTAAAGLQVAQFASGLDHPRWMYRLPNGDVLVAESNAPKSEGGGGIVKWVQGVLMKRAGATGGSANRITLLRDADGDGVAEQRSTFMTGLNSPFGMALLDGWLYVGNTDALVRVPYTEGQMRITAKPELVVKLNGGNGHWTRNVIAAEDGRTLYVAVGSKTNIADEGMDAERYRANILQVYPKEKTYRIYAAGTRNPVGMALNPQTKQLWAVVQERDMLGSDLVPDYLTGIELGDNFGWPWFYWGGYPDTRVEPSNPALQEYSKRPDFALGPHVSALGLSFAEGAKLGSRFAQGAFVGEHGSWNRKPRSGYKVVFVPFGPNGFPLPNAKPVDVLSGFLDADEKAQGRPVGVIVDANGGLLVADDVGNRIWRVTAAR